MGFRPSSPLGPALTSLLVTGTFSDPLGGNLIGFFDRLKLGDPPKARTEEEARGGQTDEGERGGEVTQL